MATVQPTTESIGPGLLRTTWANLGNADDGAPAGPAHYPNKTIYVTGTIGGASLAIQGRNGASGTFATLHDPDGSVLSWSPPTLPLAEKIREGTIEQIRPLTGGGTGTDITVVMVSEKSQ